MLRETFFPRCCFHPFVWWCYYVYILFICVYILFHLFSVYVLCSTNKKESARKRQRTKKKTVTMLRSHTLNVISCFFSCVLYLFIARTSHTLFAPNKQKMSFLRTFAHIEVGTATEYVRLFQVILWKWWDPDDRNATGSLVLQNKNLSFHASHVKSLIVWYFQCIFLAVRDFESVIFR